MSLKELKEIYDVDMDDKKEHIEELPKSKDTDESAFAKYTISYDEAEEEVMEDANQILKKYDDEDHVVASASL